MLAVLAILRYGTVASWDLDGTAIFTRLTQLAEAAAWSARAWTLAPAVAMPKLDITMLAHGVAVVIAPDCVPTSGQSSDDHVGREIKGGCDSGWCGFSHMKAKTTERTGAGRGQ